MKRICGMAIAAALLFASGVAAAESVRKQAMIEYAIGWKKPNSHLFEIVIEAETQGADALDFALPSWRPGRYIIQNYARNVQDFSASDEQERPLHWSKTDKSTWRVETSGAKLVRINYRYYANQLDAGSSLLNESEAYFNGTNLFMYIPERRNQPCRLKLLAPSDWSVASALVKDGPMSYIAANYEELADSPLIASPTLQIHQFKQGDVEYNLAFQGKLEYDVGSLAEQISKITAEQTALFGSAPFNSYWFLYHSVPGGRWHGVEHTRSTSITIPQSALITEQGRQNFYSITSHEFFHVWNVKKIRPKVFNLPDYRSEIYTRLLWFFEGVTSYYGDLMLKRAGLISERAYLTHLEKEISDLQNTPGRLITSAEEASFNGWLQPDDRDNAQISFYNKGELIGLLLDLEIRRRTANAKSLDDVMRHLNENYAQSGVPEDGIRAAVEAVAGPGFEDLFSRFISGREELPYNGFLSTVGLQLIEENDKTKPEAYLGIKISGDDRPVITNVYPESPALEAGLDRGDILLAINDKQAAGGNLSELLSECRSGERITVTVFRDRRLRRFEATLQGGGNLIYRIKPLEKRTESQQKSLASWLKNKN